MRDFKDLKIAVAGTGYVGLSLAVLLAQHHQVMAVDIVPEKVDWINEKKSPIEIHCNDVIWNERDNPPAFIRAFIRVECNRS